ncbi:MAG: ATP-binding protein [Stellaceae bacterium]
MASVKHWFRLPSGKLPLGILLFGTIVLGLFWAGLGRDALRERSSAITQAQRDTTNIAIAFREYIRRTISAVDHVMLTVKAEYAIDPDRYRLPSWIENSPLSGSMIQIGIIDANGRLRESTLGSSDSEIDLSDREHFRHHLDPSAAQPYISAPVLGRVSKKWSIQISRRLERSDGTFAGVLVFSLDPLYFSRFFDTVDLGKGGIVTLVGRDGIIRARGAMIGGGIGRDLSGGVLLEHASTADLGTYLGHSRVDGVDRIHSFAAIPGYPLLVTVGMSLDDILASPREAERAYLLAGSGLTIVVGLLVLLLLRAVRQRDETDVQLRQAQKMEAIGQLTGGVAHDFNNLLTTIAGNVERAEHSRDPDKVLQYLGNIDRAARQGARLVNHLLAFARRQRLERRAVDLNVLVCELSEMLAAAVGAEIQIDMRLAHDLWPILADSSQVETAILNVVFNARDAMPAGGRLIIETTNLVAGDPRLPPELAPRDHVSLAITDTGKGMTTEVRAKAFDPFFTTKEVGEGTGLGLSQVFGMAKQSDGSVTIDSTPDSGTTVRIVLPRAAAGEIESISTAEDRSDASDCRAAVLVVDDDFQVREFILASLSDQGYRMLEAKNGREALAVLAAEQVDVAVVDLAMPDMTGSDFVRHARSTRPDLALLFITGYAGRTFSQPPGDAPILMKPFKPAVIVRELAAILERMKERKLRS